MTFTVAVNRRHRVAQGGTWENGPTSYHRCIVWQEQAAHVLDDMRKGDRVVPTGELSSHTHHDPEGHPQTKTSIRVEDIGVVVALHQREAQPQDPRE